MTDFRNLQHYIAQIRVSPAPAEYYLEGYRLVRQCYAEAQAVLAAPFNTNNSSAEHPEQQKVLLKAYENPQSAVDSDQPRRGIIPDISSFQGTPRCQHQALPLPKDISTRNCSYALDKLPGRDFGRGNGGECKPHDASGG